MDKKYFLWGGVLLALVLTLGVIFPRPITSATGELTATIEQMVALAIKRLGAVSGPEISGESFTVNGVEHRYWSQKINPTASSTICSYRPKATSTLIFGSLGITTATNTLIFVEFGKSTFYDATTTSLGTTRVTANTKVTLIASTTFASWNDPSDPAFVFGPDDYFNVKYGASALGGTMAGNCKAEFIIN